MYEADMYVPSLIVLLLYCGWCGGKVVDRETQAMYEEMYNIYEMCFKKEGFNIKIPRTVPTDHTAVKVAFLKQFKESSLGIHSLCGDDNSLLDAIKCVSGNQFIKGLSRTISEDLKLNHDTIVQIYEYACQHRNEKDDECLINFKPQLELCIRKKMATIAEHAFRDHLKAGRNNYKVGCGLYDDIRSCTIDVTKHCDQETVDYMLKITELSTPPSCRKQAKDEL